MREILSIIIVLAFVSCASTLSSNTNNAGSSKNSPSNIVINFLEATKTNNFGRAYDYIYFPSTDKVGYVASMNDIVQKSQNKIKSYRLISTRIIGNKAYVVYELELLLNDINSSEQNLRYTLNQIELSLINQRWKIVQDYGCIENCIN